MATTVIPPPPASQIAPKLKAPDSNATLKTIADVTAEWLSEYLRFGPIRSFTSKRIGTGQVSDCHRLALTYGSETTGPATVILKIAASNDQSRSTGKSLGLYEREVLFYNDLAPHIGGATVHCYYSSYDPSGFFTILIEDVAPATVGNEVKGATIEEARLAVFELGKIHGPALRDPSLLKLEWLYSRPPVSQPLLIALFTKYLGYFKGRVSEENIEICKKLVSSWDAYLSAQMEPDVTKGIIHGDYRLDNLLFGEQGAVRSLAVVDWQTVTVGPVLSDFAYFLGAALSPADRRAHTNELLDLYLSGLGQGTEMTVEGAKRDLQLAAFFGVSMALISPMLVEHTERGDEMFIGLMERHCAQVRDLDSLSVLPAPTIPKPLLPKVEDEGQHLATDDQHWNESWYMDLIDEASGVGVYIRVGHTPNVSGSWYTAVIARPGKSLVAVTDFTCPHPGKDLSIKTARFHAEQNTTVPLQELHATLKGKGERYEDAAAALRGESGENVDLQMDLVWRTDGTPYQWRMTTRYEIPCRVSGTVILDGEKLEFKDVVGQRDHSHGARDWWGADWMWSAFHLTDGTRIHACDLRISPTTRVPVGYIQSPTLPIAEVTTCISDEKMAADGLPASAVVILAYGGNPPFSLNVEPVGHGPLRLVAPDGRVSLFTRAWAKVNTSDGRDGVGWIEWNHNQK